MSLPCLSLSNLAQDFATKGSMLNIAMARTLSRQLSTLNLCDTGDYVGLVVRTPTSSQQESYVHPHGDPVSHIWTLVCPKIL